MIKRKLARYVAGATMLALSSTSALAQESVSIDVGGGYVIKTNGEPLRIAFFALGSNNSYLDAQNEEAFIVADKLGIELDLFDGQFDPARQMDQMQVALASGNYNGWLVQAASGDILCDIASRQAPSANILVQTSSITLCGRVLGEGEELWTPGTLNFVGGNETVAAWRTLWDHAVAENPGPQKVGVIVGNPLSSITLAFMEAMEQALPSDWTVLPAVNTDYSVPDSQAKAVPLIQANPDMTIIMSAYTNISKGVVAALQQANRLDEVKIYEGGGTETALKWVDEGILEATMARYSRSPIRYSIEAMAAAWAGENVPRFMGNDGHPMEVGRAEDAAVFLVTRDNVENYHPEND